MFVDVPKTWSSLSLKKYERFKNTTPSNEGDDMQYFLFNVFISPSMQNKSYLKKSATKLGYGQET